MNIKEKNGRLIYITEINNASSIVLTEKPIFDNESLKLQKIEVEGAEPYYLQSTFSKVHYKDDTVYNFPFLFEQDQTPWVDGNLFLWSLLHKAKPIEFKALNKAASNLLEYKIFVDNSPLHLLDFDSRRPAQRISYIYFSHLLQSNVRGGTLNQKTAIVFEFYKWLCKQPAINLDINRVDKTTDAFLSFQKNDKTYQTKKVKVRSQTVKTFTSPVKTGYVRDEGEDLRPLQAEQLEQLRNALKDGNYSITERLIFDLALDTGARKQTILTIRMKHLLQFVDSNLQRNGTYRLHCGPSTGIDTKFSTPLQIDVPKKLADRLKTYAYSEISIAKRLKFKKKHGNIISDDDMYLFLSNQANPFFMAKDDPRYRKLKTPPEGVYMQMVVKKLFEKSLTLNFPKGFTFHWCRATFALRYYQFLLPAVEKGLIKSGEDIITMVQKRMGHVNRETTENYLKLFTSSDEQLEAQERYEERMFPSIDISE